MEGNAKNLIAEIEAPDDPGAASRLDSATAWLKEVLGTGIVLVAYLKSAAAEVGHAWATVLRAKKALVQVVSIKQGVDGWPAHAKVINGEGAHIKS